VAVNNWARPNGKWLLKSDGSRWETPGEVNYLLDVLGLLGSINHATGSLLAFGEQDDIAADQVATARALVDKFCSDLPPAEQYDTPYGPVTRSLVLDVLLGIQEVLGDATTQGSAVIVAL
jgi:hypothetical protein